MFGIGSASLQTANFGAAISCLLCSATVLLGLFVFGTSLFFLLFQHDLLLLLCRRSAQQELVKVLPPLTDIVLFVNMSSLQRRCASCRLFSIVLSTCMNALGCTLRSSSGGKAAAATSMHFLRSAIWCSCSTILSVSLLCFSLSK